MNSKDQENKELEAKFVVISEKPQQIIDKLLHIKAISGYDLSPKKNFEIRDIYFDDDFQRLKKSQLALRIRILEGEIYITLKGKPTFSSWGAIERLEVELPWSPNALNKIFEILNEKNIPLERSADNFSNEDPILTLERCGLQVVHDRESYRRTFNISSSVNRSQYLVELVVDTVKFHIGKQIILHHEIELETLSSEGITILKELVHTLHEQFYPEIQIWKYSKLESGIAIELLYKNKKLQKYIKGDGNLFPGGYKEIEEQIKSLQSN